MDENIKAIISNFKKSFFLGNEIDLDTKAYIEKKVSDFQNKYSGAIKGFYTLLKTSFPDALIEDWTQLFQLDRCYRYKIQFSEEKTFILMISVFEYVCIYQHPLYTTDELYERDTIKYLSQGDAIEADNISKLAVSAFSNFDWLNQKVFNTVVIELSHIDSEDLFSLPITIGDVIFTTHRL